MTLKTIAASSAAVLLTLATAACRPGPAESSGPATAKTNLAPTIYQAKGVIQEVLPEQKKVKIAHEKIPGYMDAMVMILDVKQADELKGFQPGDQVSFRMLVTDNDGWIDQLKKLDLPPVPVAAPEPSTFRRVREVEPLAVGDAMPDYAFTNAQGRIVRLSDFRGQALAFTFIFTRCPFPTFCPRLNSNFSETQTQLKALSNGPTNWHLLSITIDPEYDTPARLKGYAQQYRADPQRWDFVTGPLIDITAIGEQFGLLFWRPKPTEPIQHNVRTVVIDAAGKIQWVSPDNEWKVTNLVAQVVQAAQAKPTASAKPASSDSGEAITK
jgi:protein SCO1/2